MLFQILSDIHLESYDTLPDINMFLIPSAPYLILAGDICFYEHPNFLPFFEKISPLFQKIFYILGNHEYFDTKQLPQNSFKSIPLLIKDTLSHLINIHILQNDYYEFDSVIILGTTLWFSNRINPQDPKIKLNNNPDFIGYGGRKLPSLQLLATENENDYQWLKNFLKEHSKNKYVIVVTHYMPSHKLIPKKYKSCKDNFLFASDYDELLNYAHIWVFGHGHSSIQKNINGCFCISNTYGYPFERKNTKIITEIGHKLDITVKIE